MGQVTLSDIVTLKAFEEAGKLFNEATGLTISFLGSDREMHFYPVEQRCAFCMLIQSTEEGSQRCYNSDFMASQKAMRTGESSAYTCHAGLIDIVVPVVVAGKLIGCFNSGQSLLAPKTSAGFEETYKRVADLNIDIESLREAYHAVREVDPAKLTLAMELMRVISTHLVEGTIVLRKERELTREHRKLRRAAEEKANLERDLREMELRMVHAQLNPHFLFNTLNLIQCQAITGDVSEISRLVDDLATLLRNSLAVVGSLNALRNELDSLTSYVNIFKARFAHLIRLEINIPEAFYDISVPPMILQPIVENALIHALPKYNETFCLNISAEEVGDRVELRVADNGPGIEQDGLLALQRSLKSKKRGGKLTGLRGVNQRLKSYFPELPGIRIENTQPGLSVTLTFPLPKNLQK